MSANSGKIDGGSIMDGINVTQKTVAAPSAWQRLRSTNVSDIEWTPKRKKIAAVCLCCFSLTLLGFGAWWTIANRPPQLPQTAEEALAVMNSDKYDRLNEQQKAEYADAAAKLMDQMPWEDRRKLFKDNEKSMSEIMERKMDEMARKMARGEEVEMPWGRGGRGPGRFRLEDRSVSGRGLVRDLRDAPAGAVLERAYEGRGG
jgi:hypothetical protein